MPTTGLRSKTKCIYWTKERTDILQRYTCHKKGALGRLFCGIGRCSVFGGCFKNVGEQVINDIGRRGLIVDGL
jgi:hypothetical protein